MEYKIYTLTCPLSNNVFYIGMTKYDLDKRLKAHIYDIENINKAYFILNIIKNNATPIIDLVDSYDNQIEAMFFEKYWIHQFREWGFSLLNKKFYIKGYNTFSRTCMEHWNDKKEITKYKRDLKTIKNK